MTDIASPCIRNCCLDEDDICVGCFRSVDEIMQWRQASDLHKQEIITLASHREKEYRCKYGNLLTANNRFLKNIKPKE